MSVFTKKVRVKKQKDAFTMPKATDCHMQIKERTDRM